MKKYIAIILLGIIALIPSAYAQESTQDGGIKPDSFLYFMDVGLDNLFIKFGVSDPNTVAQERLAELEEMTILEDVEGIERAQQQLDKIKDEVTDIEIQEEVENQEQTIAEEFTVNTDDIIEALNSYTKIDQLTEGYNVFGVETTGIIEKKWYIYIAEGKISAIQEVEEFGEVDVLTVSYTQIIKIVEDQEYREKKLDQLLKYKKLKEDAESLMQKENIEEETDEDEQSSYRY